MTPKSVPEDKDASSSTTTAVALTPNDDDQQRKPEIPEPGFLERHGPWFLGLAAIAAWTLAVWQVNHEAVATAWVVAGFVLFASAAFFSRVTEVNRDGIKIAQAVRRARAQSKRLGDTRQEAQARVQYVLDKTLGDNLGIHSDVTPERVTGLSRAEMMQADQLANNLQAAFVNGYLSKHGYTVVSNTGDEIRSDMVAVKDGARMCVEFRPAVSVLQRSDAGRIATRSPPGWREGDERAVVFAKGAVLLKEAVDLLRTLGVRVFIADPDGLSVSEP